MKRAVVLTFAGLLSCTESTAPERLGARVGVWVPDAAAVLADDASGIAIRVRRRVVGDSTAMEVTWRDVYGGRVPIPPTPNVDFGRDLVLAAVGAVMHDVTIDSVVHYEAGSRTYVTEWACPTSLTVDFTGFQVVRSTRFDMVEWRTTVRQGCRQRGTP